MFSVVSLFLNVHFVVLVSQVSMSLLICETERDHCAVQSTHIYDSVLVCWILMFTFALKNMSTDLL